MSAENIRCCYNYFLCIAFSTNDWSICSASRLCAILGFLVELAFEANHSLPDANINVLGVKVITLVRKTSLRTHL